MLNRFIKIIKNSQLNASDKVLLAVSGGVDSMVLWHLFENANIKYEVAHVNYSLRENESDKDEALVVRKAKDLGVKLHLKKVDTRKKAEAAKTSIQMTARDIRYQWFDEIMKNTQLSILATAHHLNDSVETFLINLNRGTGLKGLTGIPSGDRLLRPLLQFTKKELRDYAQVQNIEFREDETNAETDYERNWFRHEILNRWEKHNPNLLDKMQLTFSRLQNAQQLLTDFLIKDTKRLEKQLHENELYVADILALVQPQEGLYFLLNPLGFNEVQITDVLSCISKQEVGKQFEANQHTLYVDREKIFIKKKTENLGENRFLIHTPSENITHPIELNFKQITINESTQVGKSISGSEHFDLELLEFPLVLRKWLPGDWMIPLGMKGKKKISDLLVDAKVPLPKKEEQYVLCSGQNIICLFGVRIDDRFKITNQTKQVLQLSFKST